MAAVYRAEQERGNVRRCVRVRARVRGRPVRGGGVRCYRGVMNAAVVLLLLAVAVRVVAEIKQLVDPPPSPPPRTITHVRYVDGWIAGRYPERYVGEHRDEPPYHIEPWDRFNRGEPLTPEQRDALVIEAAFGLEFRARRLFAGAQFKGILQGTASLVWCRSAGVEIAQLLRAHQPGPEARACLDRALGWWRAALDHGMRIFEWDRPGYDEVTDAFTSLPIFAREEVRVSPVAHGVEVKKTVETRPAPPPPSAIWPLLRLAVLLMIAILVTCTLREHKPVFGGAAEPIDCDVQLRQVLRAAGQLRVEIADDAARVATLDELVAAVRAGDLARARTLWPRQEDRDPEEVMLEAHLLLLELCDTK
jgi:hypothetical protein